MDVTITSTGVGSLWAFLTSSFTRARFRDEQETSLQRLPDLQFTVEDPMREMWSATRVTRYKYGWWCVSHQQHVSAQARRQNRKLRKCKLIRLNLTLLRQVDLAKLNAWITSEHSSKWRVDHSHRSLRLARRLG